MSAHIIIINGKGGSGKDTFVEQVNKITNEVSSTKIITHNMSSIDKIKNAAIILGWDNEKDLKGRKLLADIKSTLDEYDKDLITNDLVNQCEELFIKYYMNTLLVFVHIREPKNIDKFINIAKQRKLSNNCCKIYTLLVTNPSTDNITYNNEGDDMVSEYKYDFTIINDGTIDDLKDKARGFVDGIISCNCPFGNK